jgi:hypothetical protein
MLVDILISESGVLYKDIKNLSERVKENPFISPYDFALFILPSDYNPTVAAEYLNTFFGEKPFLAFYSTFVASNDFFTDKGLVGVFLKGFKKSPCCILETFDNLQSLENYLKSQPNKVHVVFIPYPLKEFGKKLRFFEGLEGYDATVSGLITGGADYRRSYPLLTNGGMVEDGRVAVLTFEGVQGCLASAINFKKIGPPFDFTAEDIHCLKTIDGSDAVTFFSEILKKDKKQLDHETMVGFPMLIKTEGNEYRKLIRFPKEVENGRLIFWSNLPPRGQFHFIYLLPDRKKIKSLLKRKCHEFYPYCDFVLLFYCIGKSIFVDPKEDIEFLRKKLSVPFLVIGSYGELYTQNRKLYVLNATTTFLLLKEEKEEKKDD